METLSNNDQKLLHSVRAFLVPSITEVLAYILGAAFLVLVLNAHAIWLLLADSSQINPANVREAFSAQTFFLDAHDASDKLGALSVFVVWGMIGSISYMITWALQHFYRHTASDIKGANYSMPQTARASYWRSHIAQNIYLVANLLIFAGFLLFSIPLIVGIKKLGLLTLSNLSQTQDYKYILAAILISAVWLYLFSKLWIITRYTFHLVFGDD